MEKKEDLKQYIHQLLNNVDSEKALDKGINDSLLLLMVYIAGLERQDFPLDKLNSVILADMPQQLHDVVGKLAILVADEPTEIKDYLVQELREQLKVMKIFFIPLNH